MSETSFVVGIIESLKKPMTALLNDSLSAGYRLKDCCGAERRARGRRSAEDDERVEKDEDERFCRGSATGSG